MSNKNKKILSLIVPFFIFFVSAAFAVTTDSSAVTNSGVPYAFGTWTSVPYVDVTLNCMDQPGSACDTTLYCIAARSSPCTPINVYSVPFQVGLTPSGLELTTPMKVVFYSNDTNGVSEAYVEKEIWFEKSKPVSLVYPTKMTVRHILSTHGQRLHMLTLHSGAMIIRPMRSRNAMPHIFVPTLQIPACHRT